MWTITDPDGKALVKRLESQFAAEHEAEKLWPGCEFDGDLECGATQIYVYLGSEHVGFLDPPQDLLDDLREQRRR